MSEKFCLKWNDYQSNWNKALHELRQDADLADVTLKTEDKVQFSAHKILLSSCSNLFKFIFKSNAQANPLLFFGGVNSINLGLILDYIYHGEVDVFQENLDSFLESAQKLEIEGLLGGNQDSQKNLDDHMHDTPENNIGEVKSEDEEKSLVRMDKADVGRRKMRQNK